MAYLLKQFTFAFIFLFSILLTACGGGNYSSDQPIDPIAKNFSHIEMHYKLLNNQGMIWGELDTNTATNNNEIQLTESAPSGSTILKIIARTGLMENQLITYKGTDGYYYVGQIKTLISNEEIELFLSIESSIDSGVNAWDFYANGSHADTTGYKAITDFAIKNLNFGTETTGTHVLLGDSWFDDGSIFDRLIEELPNATFINEGIGGNTSLDLVNRFEGVTSTPPDYIWIISGTNDYWQGISTEDYKANMKTLIDKSKAIGTKVIIIDSSVGEGMNQNTQIKNLFQSEEYVRVIKELL